jgi:uncharacterized protein YndB with AHSA1/START domain
MTLTPIVFDYTLRCAPAAAFDVYARRIGEWWHPAYTLNAATLAAITIEPRVGGRVFARHTVEGEIDWGRVLAWEPGRRLVYSTHLAQPPEAPSQIAVDFAAAGDGCHVHFEHGGWNEANAELRAKFRDWPILLDRFAALANGG